MEPGTVRSEKSGQKNPDKKKTMKPSVFAELSKAKELLIRIRKSAALCLVVFCVCGCSAGSAPRNPANLCAIFREKPQWYESASASWKKWGVPIPVMMAIMYKESSYISDARPRRTCLFFFPGPRRSSAFGYSQAIDSTWNIYCKHTGRLHADREEFDDAIDFIGWYCHISFVKCRISKEDAYNLYLAYHEGQNGFNQGTYNTKAWLKRVSLSVREQAQTYTRQLERCESEFSKAEIRGKSCLFF